MGEFTQEELEEAFCLVEPEEHWKGPIDAVVDVSPADEAKVRLIKAAVEHFTATSPTFHVSLPLDSGPPRLRVKAPGYWAGPAA
jgi:hypothetical protein